MMLRRQTKYTILFGYAMPDGRFGVDRERRLDKSGLELLFRALDPFQSESWMDTVNCLPSRSTAVIRIQATNGSIAMEKIIKVTKG